MLMVSRRIRTTGSPDPLTQPRCRRTRPDYSLVPVIDSIPIPFVSGPGIVINSAMPASSGAASCIASKTAARAYGGPVHRGLSRIPNSLALLFVESIFAGVPTPPLSPREGRCSDTGHERRDII